MKRVFIILAAAAVMGGFHEWSPAHAGVTGIFGNGGQTYTFDDVCHRTSFVQPGISDHEALNVLGQQVTCLVRREARLKNCYTRATLHFLNDHPRKGPEGDWSGVDQLKKCGSL